MRAIFEGKAQEDQLICSECKTYEKNYFQAEAKFLKAQDFIVK